MHACGGLVGAALLHKASQETMDVRYTHGKTMVVASLTEPQLLQVFEPPAIAALHLGQVLCIFALLAILRSRFEI